ncbi:MAG: hydrogenase expression/formation C-terminal domain-containing protein [Chromatiales bacterium]
MRDIEIHTECPDPLVSHGNVTPILHEILYALKRLEQDGETTTIDLRAMPFGPGDEEQLRKMLGRGEVAAQLDALGSSEVAETGYPGVWFLEHYNNAGERIAWQIEITRIPTILQTPAEDLAESIVRLDGQLNASAGKAG